MATHYSSFEYNTHHYAITFIEGITVDLCENIFPFKNKPLLNVKNARKTILTFNKRIRFLKQIYKHTTIKVSSEDGDYSSQNLLVQIQQRKHKNNVWNLFKVNNKDNRMSLQQSSVTMSCPCFTEISLEILFRVYNFIKFNLKSLNMMNNK